MAKRQTADTTVPPISGSFEQTIRALLGTPPPPPGDPSTRKKKTRKKPVAKR